MDTQRIRDWAASRGMVSRVLPVDALESVRIRLEHLAADGLLDADFVRGSLGGFRYLDGCSVKSPRSLILLALPRPAHVIAFRHAGCDLELILPPTYVRYSQTFDLVRDWFLDDFGLGHDQADLVSAPLKSLSAAGGLIRYGKNNVGYIRGLGSYFQLIGLAVNFPLERDGDILCIEDQRLEACRDCRVCARACLSGAIGRDRFLLRAIRCFTLFSESTNPIPETMIPSSRDCLIGCLKCQEVCPANKNLLKREHTGLTFSPLQTEILLWDSEERETSIWMDIRAKFSTLGMTEDVGLFARNLRSIIGRNS